MSNCLECGKPVPKGKRRPIQFCQDNNRRCNDNYHNRKVYGKKVQIKTCPTCGTTFGANAPNHKYCKESCKPMENNKAKHVLSARQLAYYKELRRGNANA